MKRSAALFLAILLLLSFFAACSGADPKNTCRDMVAAMAGNEKALPKGRYYSLSAPEGDAEYLSRSLISSLLGNGSYPKVGEGWLDAALYLSLGDHPCEFAVIYCRDRDTAEDTAKLFCTRLELIKITKTAPEYQKMIEEARVEVRGNYALLVISSDPDKALKIFARNV